MKPWMKIVFIIIIVLLLASSLLFYLMIKKGTFEKGGHTWISEETIEQDPDVYMGYSFSWKGFGNPTLTSMEFIRENGLVFENDNMLEVEIFIADKDNETGVVDAQYAKEEGLLEQYENVEDFKVEDDLLLIVHAHFLKPVPDDITGLRINFTSFGIKRTEIIPFEGIVKREVEE